MTCTTGEPSGIVERERADFVVAGGSVVKSPRSFFNSKN